jgi:hypothetical protein
VQGLQRALMPDRVGAGAPDQHVRNASNSPVTMSIGFHIAFIAASHWPDWQGTGLGIRP